MRAFAKTTNELRSVAPFQRCSASSSALDWLSKFTNYEQKGVPTAAGTNTDAGFDLKPIQSLLTKLDAPHTHQPAVHIAGTKGKGSIVTMISAILQASGYTVGTYTSPHITTIHERIRIDGTPISHTTLDTLISTQIPTIEAQHAQHDSCLSHFEILTALAFKHFSDQKIDIAVIETGLGGARDATNVLEPENVLAAVISAIGFDHKAALGGSIESIATAKAGIMKNKKPVVIGRQMYSEAYDVLVKHARELECPTIDISTDFTTTSTNIQWTNADNQNNHNNTTTTTTSTCHQIATLQPHARVLSDFFKNQNSIDIALRMVGSHQVDNAAAAVATAATLANQGFTQITPQTVVQGLEKAQLPGRFQMCHFLPSTNTTTTIETSDTTDTTTSTNTTSNRKEPIVVLDGAHTEESAAALVDTFHTIFGINTPVSIVLAMADDKPHTEFCIQLRRLQPVAVVLTQVAVGGGSTRAAAPGVLLAAWHKAGFAVHTNNAANRQPQPQQRQAADVNTTSTTTMRSSVQKPIRRRTRELVQASLVAAVERACMELKAQCTSDEVGVVLVCGSLHAVSAALQQLELDTK